MVDQKIHFLRLLEDRLERLSADSYWARRASGLRRNIMKVLESIDSGQVVDESLLLLLTESSFNILYQAAKEIPDMETSNKKIMK